MMIGVYQEFECGLAEDEAQVLLNLKPDDDIWCEECAAIESDTT